MPSHSGHARGAERAETGKDGHHGASKALPGRTDGFTATATAHP